MNVKHKTRTVFAAMGAVAALSVYFWFEIIEANILTGRSQVVGVVATAVFFGALLAIAPCVIWPRALRYAAAHAGFVALLVLVFSFRFETATDVTNAHYMFLPMCILCTLPLPFFIAHANGNWRDYTVLFEQAYQIALRFGAGLGLMGVVWALIYLSNALLSLVGLDFVDRLFEIEPAPYIITGAAAGFGIALAGENLAALAMQMVLMMLRPLLPAIVVVVAIFLLALPFRGLSGLFGAFSAGATMLAISVISAMMVTAVVGTQGSATTTNRFLLISARVMSGLMPILAAVAMVAVGQRVQQYGWTPARLMGAVFASFSLGYGLFYIAAALRADWIARIRRANIAMALVTVAVAALTLTPVLNAERLSTNSQMARFADGRTKSEVLDIRALQDWGLPGQAALRELAALSKEPGREVLAARLKDTNIEIAPSPEQSDPAVQQDVPSADDLAKRRKDSEADVLRGEVIAALPVQPPSATAAQRRFVQAMSIHPLLEVKAACARPSGDLAKSCVMLVADILPNQPGDEGVIAIIEDYGTLRLYGFRTYDGNNVDEVAVYTIDDTQTPRGDQAIATLRGWQASMPQLTPAPMMQLPLGDGGAILLP